MEELPKVEISLSEFPVSEDNSLKINGHRIGGVRSINFSSSYNDVTEITIKLIGQVDAEVRGHVNVVEEHVHEHPDKKDDDEVFDIGTDTVN